MGGYNDLKTAIAALIRTNDNQEITGAILQSALLSIINTIGQGSVFKGVATTSTNPGSPDANVFYIAGRPGYYPNFNLELTAGLHVIENKSGTWVNTEIALDVVDAVNIGGAKHVKPSQAMIIALQSVEQIPDSEGRNNAMWWSTDGNLKYKQNDTVYNLGAPAYVLYYCGDKIYKWTGSGFREIGGGGSFASGEALSNMSIFDDGSDTDGKSSAQLAAMIPSGEVIKSLLEIISSIETSGGSYDGVDLITTFSYDAPTRVITVKQSGRQAKTILLPLANSTNAGLMSSEDKTALANMQNLIGKTVNNFSKSTDETGITITLVTTNGTPYAVLIPVDSAVSYSSSNPVAAQAIYTYLRNNYAGLDVDSFVYALRVRILPLVSMGSDLDNGNTPAQINTNEFRYDPTTKRIYRHNNNDEPWFLPQIAQLYLNICTGKMYKWTGSDMEEISSGMDPSTLAGKADKHTAADILTPSQWPRVMLYNIESMWGAGGTPPDYASIPVGSIYLDEPDSADDPPYKRLFYKKTLEGQTQRIDLGAPQENTIYCHISTGNLYRWVPTQNGNDGAFQQVGGNLVLPHIGTNGNWWVGPETDPNNDTGIKAQGPKGDTGATGPQGPAGPQGPKGDSGVASADEVVVVHDLDGEPDNLPQGKEAVLGADIGEEIGDRLDEIDATLNDVFGGEVNVVVNGNRVTLEIGASVSEPRLIINAYATNFMDTELNTSKVKHFTLTGRKLTANASISIASSNSAFLLSADGTNYLPTISLNAGSDGKVSQVVYVKFTPTSETSYSATITATCGTASATTSYQGTGAAEVVPSIVLQSNLDTITTDAVGNSATLQFVVYGYNLNAPIALSASVDSGSTATLDTNSVSAAEAENGKVVTLTFTPGDATDDTITITATSSGATAQELEITGKVVLPPAVDDTFEVEGINYKVTTAATMSTSGNVQVIAKSSGKYSGEVIIPNTISKDWYQFNVTSIESSAFQSSNVTRLTIGDNITSFGGGAWQYQLVYLKGGTGLTSIGAWCLQRCSALATVVLESGVTSIGAGAFDQCSAISSFTCKATTPPSVSANSFPTLSSATLYVPSASVSAYQSATGWSNFGNITAITE